jgi:predicted NAD/FAD-dependent oxidoreductase
LLHDFNALYSIDASVSKTIEWTSGMPMFPPGRYRAIIEFQKRQRRPGLHFCGDYLLGPLIEGAVTTGFGAAGAIQA